MRGQLAGNEVPRAQPEGRGEGDGCAPTSGESYQGVHTVRHQPGGTRTRRRVRQGQGRLRGAVKSQPLCFRPPTRPASLPRRPAPLAAVQVTVGISPENIELLAGPALQRLQQKQASSSDPSDPSMVGAVEIWNGTAPPNGSKQVSTLRSSRRLNGFWSFIGALVGWGIAVVFGPVVGAFVAVVAPIVLSGIGAIFDGEPIGKVGPLRTLGCARP